MCQPLYIPPISKLCFGGDLFWCWSNLVSVPRFTCVNKRKLVGVKQKYNQDKDGLSQPECERSAAMVRRTHLSHTRNITLSRIKCERYIFIKKCVRLFIEVRRYVWLCSAYICIMYMYCVVVCGYTTGRCLIHLPSWVFIITMISSYTFFIILFFLTVNFASLMKL